MEMSVLSILDIKVSGTIRTPLQYSGTIFQHQQSLEDSSVVDTDGFHFLQYHFALYTNQRALLHVTLHDLEYH